MTERMKPPARRTGGRALGGARKTTPPPPPPAAELTHEQFAAEEAAAQGDGRPPAGEPQVQPAPSTVPIERSARGRTETALEAARPSTQPTAEVTQSGLVSELATSQPVRPAVVAPDAGAGAPGEPVERQAPPVVPAAEVAIRPAVPPMAGGTTFPVRTEGPGYQEQNARSQEASSVGTPYAHGPGRPSDVPDVAVLLNQRIIARESLDSSVPAALKLKKRIKRFALDNELDHLPIGDIVSVALDEWLTARGF
ncbi:hypothetical protein SGFS_082270 [Streptomyces graminofaciens]|uniref:Uncharacterized protein n=1 Tax=Streptomyces graminofaciens TaxID=68212 RepID=A0ABN5VUN0_9ACTN|nr:hypothetical protein [Streptomyces graminofaciens]BBC36933.1 hypothetical protein SGFS_082270 [Streptomyces graminofaciens]